MNRIGGGRLTVANRDSCLMISSGGLVMVDSGGSEVDSGGVIIVGINNAAALLLHFNNFFGGHVSTDRDAIVHRVRWRDERCGWRWSSDGGL